MCNRRFKSNFVGYLLFQCYSLNAIRSTEYLTNRSYVFSTNRIIFCNNSIFVMSINVSLVCSKIKAFVELYKEN